MWTNTQPTIWCKADAKTKQGSGGMLGISLLLRLHFAVRKWCPEISSLKQTQRKRKRGDANDRNDIFHICKLKVKSVRRYHLDESKFKCGT